MAGAAVPPDRVTGLSSTPETEDRSYFAPLRSRTSPLKTTRTNGVAVAPGAGVELRPMGGGQAVVVHAPSALRNQSGSMLRSLGEGRRTAGINAKAVAARFGEEADEVPAAVTDRVHEVIDMGYFNPDPVAVTAPGMSASNSGFLRGPLLPSALSMHRLAATSGSSPDRRRVLGTGALPRHPGLSMDDSSGSSPSTSPESADSGSAVAVGAPAPARPDVGAGTGPDTLIVHATRAESSLSATFRAPEVQASGPEFTGVMKELISFLKGMVEEAGSRDAAEASRLMQSWFEKILEQHTAAAPAALDAEGLHGPIATATGVSVSIGGDKEGEIPAPYIAPSLTVASPGADVVGAGKEDGASLGSVAAASVEEDGEEAGLLGEKPGACRCGKSTCMGCPCIANIKSCASAVISSLKSCWNHEVSINLYCTKVTPKVSTLVVLLASTLYGILYGDVSNSKARSVLGNIADAFSAFSCISNFAQGNITLALLREDFKRNFKNALGYIGSGVEFSSCGKVRKKDVTGSNITKTIFGLISVALCVMSNFTAAPLAAATATATASCGPVVSGVATYGMWGVRNLLAFKSSMGLLDTVGARLSNLIERWREVKNGDKSISRASLETATLGLAAYVAVEYSLSQEGSIGEYSDKQWGSVLEPIFSALNYNTTAEREALFTALGVGPLFALNTVFIVGGGETGVDFFDRFHPLLLATFLCAGPTGFPGIALIDDDTLMAKFTAYIGAVLSNWRSLEQLPYVKGKMEKDRAISSMNSLRLALGDISEYCEKKIRAEEAEARVDGLEERIRTLQNSPNVAGSSMTADNPSLLRQIARLNVELGEAKKAAAQARAEAGEFERPEVTSLRGTAAGGAGAEAAGGLADDRVRERAKRINGYKSMMKCCHALHDVLLAYTSSRERATQPTERVVAGCERFDGMAARFATSCCFRGAAAAPAASTAPAPASVTESTPLLQNPDGTGAPGIHM